MILNNIIHMVEQLAVETLVCLFLVTLFLMMSVYLQKYNVTITQVIYIHESGVSIVLGMLAGALILWTRDEPPSKFEAPIFFQFMLPFLIFGVGYNMKRRRFFRNLGHIISNGLLGTLISFVILSTFAWTFSELGVIKDADGTIRYLTLKDSLALGGVLSSTEMAVTLSVLHENKTPRLHSLMFGESIINTAISILLVRTVVKVNFDAFTAGNSFGFIGLFLYNCVTSILVGTLFGFISSLFTKNFSALKTDPSKEVALQFYVAWSGYIVAEMLGISGVITILVNAIISGHYAWYNLTAESRIVVNDTFYLLGDGTNALIFSYLGLTTFSYKGSQISYTFIMLMIVVIVLSRLVSTFGLAFIEAVIKRLLLKKYAFDTKNLSVIWFGGLFRGTIAFALIITADTEHEEILQVTVLGLVIFSMLIFGVLMPIWVTIVKPQEIIQPYLSVIEDAADGDLRRSLIGTGRINFLMTKDDVSSNKGWFHRKWRHIDNNYIKPCLIDKEKLEEQKRLKEELEAKAKQDEAIIEESKADESKFEDKSQKSVFEVAPVEEAKVQEKQ